MAGYTKINLKQDVEDMAKRFDLSPGLESRFARKPLELERSGVSYYKIAPSFRTPFGHKHGEQEEVYVVVSGSARLKLDDDVQELAQWDAVRVAAQRCAASRAAPTAPRCSRSARPTRTTRTRRWCPAGGATDARSARRRAADRARVVDAAGRVHLAEAEAPPPQHQPRRRRHAGLDRGDRVDLLPRLPQLVAAGARDEHVNAVDRCSRP